MVDYQWLKELDFRLSYLGRLYRKDFGASELSDPEVAELLEGGPVVAERRLNSILRTCDYFTGRYLAGRILELPVQELESASNEWFETLNTRLMPEAGFPLGVRLSALEDATALYFQTLGVPDMNTFNNRSWAVLARVYENRGLDADLRLSAGRAIGEGGVGAWIKVHDKARKGIGAGLIGAGAITAYVYWDQILGLLK
jgi:hypothetical protein